MTINTIPAFPKDSLFATANYLYRNNKPEESGCIYELLAESHPDFPQYAFNLEIAKAASERKTGRVYSRFHLEKASEYQKRLRVADTLSGLQDPQLIELAFPANQVYGDGQIALAKANASISLGYEKWVQHMNDFLGSRDLGPLTISPKSNWRKPHAFLNLQGKARPKIEGGPLVTVCIACYNAEAYVEEAILSILNQTYRNLEIFLVDDRSEDKTLEILKRLAAYDTRISVMENSQNSGTYVSRNKIFSLAKGKYFTILDADDFALPDRIAMQVAHLEGNPDHVGVMTDWLRLDMDCRVHFRHAWGGSYQHEAVATLMISTNQARSTIGYWDSVRFSADTEYLYRLRKVFGKKNVSLLKKPTVLALQHSASLTNHPVTGMNVGGMQALSPARSKYRSAWKKWHEAEGEKIFMEFPSPRRPFSCPAEMLP
jgi:hypothetical protein